MGRTGVRQTIGNDGIAKPEAKGRRLPPEARSVAAWQTGGNAGTAKPEATGHPPGAALRSFGYRIPLRPCKTCKEKEECI